MKRLIYKTLLFIVIIMLADFSIGNLLTYMQKNVKGGGVHDRNYIANNATEDILIFGSSRALHHYVPQIIEDSLPFSCYNCGAEANGAILMYGRYRQLTSRYTPKAIIYDIMPDYDYGINDNLKYLSHLKDYYSHPGVREIFNAVDKKEAIKMHSKLYLHNSKIISIASNFILSRKNMHKGYMPLEGTMEIIPEKPSANEPLHTDSLKIAFLERLIKECKQKEIKLIFTISPSYYETDMSQFAPIKELCNRYGTALLDYGSSPMFIEKREYFKDSTHLNHEGASLFTSAIIHEIKKALAL